MKRWALLLAACICASAALGDELTPAKGDDIRLLMQETGAGNMGVQMGQAMMPLIMKNLSASHPEIPSKSVEKIGARLGDLFAKKTLAPGGILDAVVPIYAKHFSHDEIKQLLAFYRTDVGRKIIKSMPMVLAESMEAGQKWGQSLGPEIQALVYQALVEDKVVLNKK